MRLILLNRLSPTNLKFDVEASTSSTLQDDMLSLRTAEGVRDGAPAPPSDAPPARLLACAGGVWFLVLPPPRPPDPAPAHQEPLPQPAGGRRLPSHDACQAWAHSPQHTHHASLQRHVPPASCQPLCSHAWWCRRWAQQRPPLQHTLLLHGPEHGGCGGQAGGRGGGHTHAHTPGPVQGCAA